MYTVATRAGGIIGVYIVRAGGGVCDRHLGDLFRAMSRVRAG